MDSPARAGMWRDMAMINTALNHCHDATICWINSFWDQDSPDQRVVEEWLRCEMHGSSAEDLTIQQLAPWLCDPAMLGGQSPLPEPSLVVAYLCWSAGCQTPPSSILGCRSELGEFLQQHEERLPVRAVWLAWMAIYKMSGNDLLLLARARDRLLERLFHRGLTAEADMASFLRIGSGADSDRFRVLRDQLLQLHQQSRDWISEPAITKNPQTKRYADLVFAFAFARLGETAHCNRLLEQVAQVLDRGDPIHKWVYRAFEMRIQQALSGRATQGQMSGELLQQLESMNRMDRYKLDRLRQHSRILEPHLRIDPYRNWHGRYEDDLSRKLAMLQNILDRDELNSRIHQLMNEHSAPADRVRILPGVLQLSPRAGETLACELLEQVPAAIALCDGSMEKAMLLQRSLHIAAHFGRTDLVQGFVAALDEAMPTIVSDYLNIESQLTLENKEKSEAIESLLTQSFRGLRKLGMRDEIGGLYACVAQRLNEPSASHPSKSSNGGVDHGSRTQRLLLCVAGGWFYFGQQQQAKEIVDHVLAILGSGELPSVDQKGLTCAYLDAVSQAPVDEAVGRVQQFFATDEKGEPLFPKISDNMTTCSHFSISQLDVIEAAVMSLIHDDFSISGDARRWIDEDEFLVRQRIHRDIHRASSK